MTRQERSQGAAIRDTVGKRLGPPCISAPGPHVGAPHRLREASSGHCCSLLSPRMTTGSWHCFPPSWALPRSMATAVLLPLKACQSSGEKAGVHTRGSGCQVVPACSPCQASSSLRGRQRGRLPAQVRGPRLPSRWPGRPTPQDSSTWGRLPAKHGPANLLLLPAAGSATTHGSRLRTTGG